MSQFVPDAGEFILGALGTRLSNLVAAIEEANALWELAGLAPEVREIGFGLLDLDAGADLATRTVAKLNDVLTERIITVVARSHHLPPVPWCWLSMGSEGRCEQTFVTDQDNGLLFRPARGDGASGLRQLFLPFAGEVNAALAACGFPLCEGEVMAGNPKWCLSFDEWCAHFSDWIRIPEPCALLNASIFFDFRPVYGDSELATTLRGRLLGMTAENTLFLHMMSANALAAAPPLGFFGGVVAADKEAGVDLKKFGARLFVDAARILALGAGMSPVNTSERLRAVAAAGDLSPADATACIQAFEHIQRLRLVSQRCILLAHGHANNCVREESLNTFESRVLREALKQAQRLQQQLKITFGA